jgi:hypothetical protein
MVKPVRCPVSCWASRRFVGALVVVWLAVGTASAGAATWSIEPTPNPPGALVSVLTGVSCATPHSCAAVGFYQTSSAGYTLALHRNASGWQLQATPNPSASPYTFLHAVSCATPRTCTAVGNSTSFIGPGATLAERWDGGTWQIQATPNPAHPRGGSTLNGVSCPNPRLCTAVGQYTVDPDITPSLSSTLAEQWNGVQWDVQPTPNPSGVSSASLNGVSCAKRSACTAIGPTFAERWDGTSWELQSLPSPPDAVGISLSGVSCATPDACTAVGTFNTPTEVRMLALRWNGSNWQIQPMPNPAGATVSVLSGVSCPTKRSCTAVGFYETDAGSFTLIERWNGTRWGVEPSPNVPAAGASVLSSVSCTPGLACTAVGTYSTSAGGFTLVVRSREQR